MLRKSFDVVKRLKNESNAVKAHQRDDQKLHSNQIHFPSSKKTPSLFRFRALIRSSNRKSHQRRPSRRRARRSNKLPSTSPCRRADMQRAGVVCGASGLSNERRPAARRAIRSGGQVSERECVRRTNERTASKLDANC